MATQKFEELTEAMRPQDPQGERRRAALFETGERHCNVEPYQFRFVAFRARLRRDKECFFSMEPC